MAGDADPPKKKGKVKLLIILFILLLFVGGGGTLAWFLLGDRIKPMLEGVLNKVQGTEQTESVQPDAPPQPGRTVPLPAFATNLADPLGRRLIRLKIELEVSDPKVREEVERNAARVRDAVLLLLSSKTYADISAPENKVLLKSEITERLNTVLGRGKVIQIFITDLIVQ
ncbi:MAG: flagellar basal body-associated FliL family protein [Desulfovibrio sp.]|jgi:flagellar FliL protein|nr:flagellar basal body-associated FliL family protein [Desulfovibrio sp.]